MSAKSDVNTPVLITAVLASGLFLLVLLLGVQAWFASEEQAEREFKAADAVFVPLANLRAEQQQRITQYRWVDREGQLVAIPIDQAMKIMVETKGHFPTTQPTTVSVPG